jgi:hypothetical protein
MGPELSDDDTRVLINYLQDKTPLRLNFLESMDVIRGIAHAGYVLRKPTQHPSGSTEAAITTVVPLGCAFVGNGSPIVDASGNLYKGARR